MVSVGSVIVVDKPLHPMGNDAVSSVISIKAGWDTSVKLIAVVATEHSGP